MGSSIILAALIIHMSSECHSDKVWIWHLPHCTHCIIN